MERLTRNFDENMAEIERRLPLGSSFDLIGRHIKVGERQGFFVSIDGFVKDEILYYIINTLQDLEAGFGEEGYVQRLIREKIAYLEVDGFTEFTAMTNAVLSGAICLIVSGESSGVIIDAREYPGRTPSESETEKVTRGAKDGFVETIVFNTALIRRRVRDEDLVFEMKTVGSRSKTDVCLGYIKGLADEHLLNELRGKIDAIEVDALVMAEKSLEELLVKKKWYNPLPQVKYTERPDIAASYLTEGHVVILVDTSPSAMIAPATMFYFSQFAEDYYQNPMVGTYDRLVRFATMALTVFLIPLWLLLVENKSSLPEFLSFIGVKESGSLPLFMQFLILEFGYDLLKTSSLHTPSYLGGAFGIIGGLLLGEFAIKVGFFIPETIFYMALTIMASYCIPSVEFSNALRIFRLFLLIATGIFGIWGFVCALAVIFIITATTKTLDSRISYLWPLWPWNGKAMSRVLFRKSVKSK